MSKSPDAFRTISEVAEWLGVQAHVLRFWESKFTQVKPVKRAGGRRYYRPADMQLLGGIKKLLHDDGLPIKEVQALLREHGAAHVAGFSHPLDAAAEERPADVPPADKLGDDWQSSLDLTPEPDAQDAAFPAADGGNVVGFPQPPAAQGPRPGSPAEGAAPQMRMDLDATAAQEPAAAAGDTPEPAADSAAGAGPASPWQDSLRDDAPEDGAPPPEAPPAAARDTAPEPAEAPAQEPFPADGLLPSAPPPAAAEAEPSPDAAPAEDDGAEPAAEAPPAFAPESEPAAVQDTRPAAAEAAAEPADRADRPDAGPGQDLAPAPAAAADPDPDPAAEQPAPEPADTEAGPETGPEAGPEPADEPLLEAELAPLGEHGSEPLADTGTESGPFADLEPLAETALATGPAPADTPGAPAEPVAFDAPDLAEPDSAPEAEPAAAQDTLVAAAGLQPEEPLDFGSPADPLAGHPPHGQADGAQDALEDALEDPAADPAASFPPHDLDAAARQVDALEFASGFNGPGGAQPAPEAAEAAPEGPEAADPEAAEPEAEEAPAAAPHPGILAHLAAIRSLPPQSVAAIQACAEELRALASNR